MMTMTKLYFTERQGTIQMRTPTLVCVCVCLCVSVCVGAGVGVFFCHSANLNRKKLLYYVVMVIEEHSDTEQFQTTELIALIVTHPVRIRLLLATRI